MAPAAKRKMTVNQRIAVKKAYSQYVKMGLPKKEAWKWAWKLTMFAKDHWAPPKCGW